ncbi:hypothetical protein BI036_gp109 [Morganella phage vB_MmoM_MP1]|uniref:Uncharacterized protein n=1 Tax=Morganella phage vB_MmoM_MP1 TaxID=1852628 RepID=A0A192Y9U1_9CAUD|nr:hypothetical protein BI036_gp109 [Morganella phage vB_MmoM_MP1]ANM46499.1 hypothetical protein MP1_gp0108 [Morganella phage vB_MmoM_MP1]
MKGIEKFSFDVNYVDGSKTLCIYASDIERIKDVYDLLVVNKVKNLSIKTIQTIFDGLCQITKEYDSIFKEMHIKFEYGSDKFEIKISLRLPNIDYNSLPVSAQKLYKTRNDNIKSVLSEYWIKFYELDRNYDKAIVNAEGYIKMKTVSDFVDECRRRL